jgi:hypothetical protein
VTAARSADEVRDAKRQRAFHSAKDFETSASQLGDIQATEIDAKRKASILVAANVPKGEVEEVLLMLGIHPSQPDFDDGPLANVPRLNTMDQTGAR